MGGISGDGGAFSEIALLPRAGVCSKQLRDYRFGQGLRYDGPSVDPWQLVTKDLLDRSNLANSPEETSRGGGEGTASLRRMDAHCLARTIMFR